MLKVLLVLLGIMVGFGVAALIQILRPPRAEVFQAMWSYGPYRPSGDDLEFSHLPPIPQTVPKVKAGELLTYRFQLRNRGSQSHRYRVQASGPPGWITSIEPTEFELGPKDSHLLQVSWQIPLRQAGSCTVYIRLTEDGVEKVFGQIQVKVELPELVR